MSGLLPELLRRIRADGPMTVADYMRECLLHPLHGYYTNRTPFGALGDFTTAPEISQMFGELLGLALAQSWLDQGAPPAFTLAEFGPGRGTMMCDVLRATRGVAGFHSAMILVLSEASPRLRDVQKAALAGYDPIWINAPVDLPEAPLFLLANEFFDALPIHQYQRSPDGWRERLVCEQDGALAFGLSAPLPVPMFDQRFSGDPPGTVVELCPAAAGPIRAIAGRIGRHGGAAIIADYGGWRSRGDTFQAVRRHQFSGPLQNPGEADLTAHVDFEALAQHAALAHAYETQGTVLLSLGLAERSQKLAASLTGAALELHLAAARRLTAPGEMGDLFKMMALFPPHAPCPPGFA